MGKDGKSIAVIVVASGRGLRTGGDLPKQYRKIAGRPVLRRTLDAFLKTNAVDAVLPVINPDDEALFAALTSNTPHLLKPVFGGVTRQASVYAGLRALATQNPDWDYVLIHDAARPFVSAETIENVISALADNVAVVPAVSVTDTIKRSSDGKRVEGTEPREHLFTAQTPQGFHFRSILAAHEQVCDFGQVFTDDASIAEHAGHTVALCAGNIENFKLTIASDFARAEQMISGERQMETRVGSGYDIHPFVEGDAVILGGVRIPHAAKLKGHSDADAGLHVLTDALLGALAEGDIGTHFPPSDPQWKGEPSSTFLSFAVERVAARGGRIVHLDLTIMCELPKIAPHTDALRKSIAGICGIAPSRVSVKATTSEKMGFVGRGEGLATMGTATIEIPREAD